MKLEMRKTKSLQNAKSRANSKRVLSYKESMHLVLRLRQNIPYFFEPNDKVLKMHILQVAKKYQIRVYHLILNHTHMHAAILLPDRKSYVGFIRELTGFLAKYFTEPLKKLGFEFDKIFLNRPFTKVVSWGRAYNTLIEYMRKNERESGVKQINIRPNKMSVSNKTLKATQVIQLRNDSQLWFELIASTS